MSGPESPTARRGRVLEALDRQIEAMRKMIRDAQDNHLKLQEPKLLGTYQPCAAHQMRNWDECRRSAGRFCRPGGHMTSEMIWLWHCDGPTCDQTATEDSDGWINAGNTHGCPEHNG